jgi:hypothetical protein
VTHSPLKGTRPQNKTQKTLERLNDMVLSLSAKLVLSKLRVEQLNESLHTEGERKLKRRKTVEELRASRTSNKG